MVGDLLVLELSSSCMFACGKIYGPFRREEICKVLGGDLARVLIDRFNCSHIFFFCFFFFFFDGAGLEDQPLANAHIAYNALKFLERTFNF